MLKNFSRLVLFAFFASTIAVGSYVIPDHGVLGIKLNSNVVDNSTLQYSGNQVSVKALGVGTSQLAAQAVTTAKIADQAVTGSQLQTNVALPGGNVKAAGQWLAVSTPSSTAYQRSIWGCVDENGVKLSGVGFTSQKFAGPGHYGINFAMNDHFTGSPAVVATNTTAIVFAGVRVTAVSSTGATISTYDVANAGAFTDGGFCFTATGQN